MIKLFEATETEFSNNGIGVLSDAISCVITEEANGIYECQMVYPTSGIFYSELTDRRIIFAKPTPYKEPQPFRIYRITKPITKRVTVYARHISYDLAGIPVLPFTAQSLGAALLGLKNNETVNTLFTFWTDKTVSADFSVSVPSSVRSLIGGQSGSILDVYGGELEWDRFTVKLWSRRGETNGVTIRYGKNLTQIVQDSNNGEVYTGVLPYWVSAEQETLVGETVNIPGNYTYTKIKPLDLTAEFEEMPTIEDLQAKAEEYVESTSIGDPKFSIDFSFVPLEQTTEFQSLVNLEKVNLFDTITVIYPELGVNASAKCVKTVYDAVKGRYTSLEIGHVRSNITTSIRDQQKEIENIGSSSAFQEAINANSGWITNGQRGEMVAIKRNNQWVEIASLDTGDINTAQKVWRWNNGGFGYSSTGYNGNFELALTEDGAINASMIVTGILNAAIIQSGLLSSVNGATWIDMESGTFNFGNGALSFDGTTFSLIANDIQTVDEEGNTSTVATEQGVSDAIAPIQQDVDSLNEALDVQNGFITITPSIPEIKLGKTGQSGGVSVTGDKVKITGSDNAEAILESSKLTTAQIQAENVGIGSFMWVHRSANNHLSLKWVGD